MTDPDAPFVQAVGRSTARKLRARRRRGAPVLSGLGVMGLVGWSVAVPTVLGAALGVWLDRAYPGGRSWTLALLVAGLCLGCLTAWHWVSREVEPLPDDRDEPPAAGPVRDEACDEACTDG